MQVSAGRFEIESSEQLFKLLATMIRNKVVDRARREGAERREMARISETPVDELALRGADSTPSQIVEARELVEHLLEMFTADERQIVERRMNGQEWDEIADALGGLPDAMRKKMSRAMARVARESGVSDPKDD